MAITTLNSKDTREKANAEMMRLSLPVCQSSSHVSDQRNMIKYTSNEML
jgi:hypothetical protein